MSRNLVGAAVLALAATVAGPALAAKAPKSLAWAMELVDDPVRTEPGEPGVFLLDERTITPLGRGRVQTTQRTLLRVLSSEGLHEELQPVYYRGKGSLRWYRAWTIHPDGTVREVEKKYVVDQGLSDYSEFSDLRRVWLPMPKIGVGSHVALAYELEEDEVFPQVIIPVQSDYPVVRARVILDLLASWEYRATFRNIAPVEPVVDGSRYAWEFRDLPGLPGYSSAAGFRETAATIALTYHPKSKPQPFGEWAEVATWAKDQIFPQAISDDSIRAAVSDLSAEDPLRSIGSYVQQLRYIHVALGRSGYVPYRSSEVFEKRYGDCKDKATLMMTMLREAGIDSYPILVNTRDDGSIYPEFPSPGQFNHVVLGVPLADGAAFQATTVHPELGTMLVFDPTDEQTPVGDLPWTDQGTFGLLVHPEAGSLVSLPVLPPSASRADREWTVEMDAAGTAQVGLEAVFTGQYARQVRAWVGGRNDAEREEAMTAALAARVPGTRVGEMSFQGLDVPEEAVKLSVKLDVERFSRPAGPMRLMEPMRFIMTMAPDLPADPGGRPAMVPFQFHETDRFRLRLPEHWRLSDPPEGATGESEFGRWSLRISEGEDGVELVRDLVVETLEVPLKSYDAARKFFNGSAQLLLTPLVLQRAPP